MCEGAPVRRRSSVAVEQGQGGAHGKQTSCVSPAASSSCSSSCSDASGDDQKPTKRTVYLATFLAAFLGLFFFGWDAGAAGGTFQMAGFRAQMGWPPAPAAGEAEPDSVSAQQGWITALYFIGTIAGSAPAAWAADRIGRRWATAAAAAVLVAGLLLEGFAWSIGAMYVARLVAGAGAAGTYIATTAYQSEIAPEHVRGLLLAMPQLFGMIGTMLGSVLDFGLSGWPEAWRVSYAGPAALVVLGTLLLPLCPESPRWLYQAGRVDDARGALSELRHPSEVTVTLEHIAAEHERRAQESGGWRAVFSSADSVRYCAGVSSALAILQQLTGYVAILYFAPAIFGADKGVSPAGAMMILTTVLLLGAGIGAGFMDTLGRRGVLVYGGAAMTVVAAAIAILTSPSVPCAASAALSGLVIGCAALYLVLFSLSWGSVANFLPAELMPSRVRGRTVCLANALNSLGSVAVARAAPAMLAPAALDIWGSFLVYSTCCAGMTLFALLFVPETSGVVLERMGEHVGMFRAAPLLRRATRIRIAPVEEGVCAVGKETVAPAAFASGSMSSCASATV